MPDLVDQAQEREEAERDAALASFRRGPEAALDVPSTGVCIDCGDDIAPARRQALPHARRCIDCQELRERAPR